MNKYKLFTVSFCLVLMLIAASVVIKFDRDIESNIDSIELIDNNLIKQEFDSNYSDDAIINQVVSQASNNELYNQVFDYISRTSKETSTLDRHAIASTIISQALEHNIDICFVLAQGTLETHLGTAGIGKSQKSIFGVGKTYNSYEDCINNYFRLLTRSYLGKQKTIHDLLDNYITIKGYRYSENPDYEKMLKQVYHKVISTTNIYNLQNQS